MHNSAFGSKLCRKQAHRTFTSHHPLTAGSSRCPGVAPLLSKSPAYTAPPAGFNEYT